jgi:hypothetical protein
LYGKELRAARFHRRWRGEEYSTLLSIARAGSQIGELLLEMGGNLICSIDKPVVLDSMDANAPLAKALNVLEQETFLRFAPFIEFRIPHAASFLVHTFSKILASKSNITGKYADSIPLSRLGKLYKNR